MFREERLRSKLHVWTSRAESAWPIYDPDYRRRRLQAACKAASNHEVANRVFSGFAAHKDEVTDIAWSVMTRSTVSGCPLSMISKLPPRPVSVPPTEIVRRHPPAVVMISASVSFRELMRVCGNIRRYSGECINARQSLPCLRDRCRSRKSHPCRFAQ